MCGLLMRYVIYSCDVQFILGILNYFRLWLVANNNILRALDTPTQDTIPSLIKINKASGKLLQHDTGPGL